MSAIEARLAHFHTLHNNPWFNVMNWVLDQLRLPKEERRRHVGGYCFYFHEREIPQKHWVYNYNKIW
jgi:hypothetical protein